MRFSKHQIKKIAVIGNGGAGKTTLSRSLAKRYHLKLTHVDSIQYLSGMKIRDRDETSQILNTLAEEENWLIDGFGRMDVMRKRFALADKIVFIDFPLWRHYWWCTKRQIMSIWSPRGELPDGCNEASLSYTLTLFKILWRVHAEIRPQLIDIFSSPEIKSKVFIVKTLSEWCDVFDQGLD